MFYVFVIFFLRCIDIERYVVVINPICCILVIFAKMTFHPVNVPLCLRGPQLVFKVLEGAL